MPEQNGSGQAQDEDESARERYRELLEELRTVMPGAQVLFAFLLIAPFSARFAELDRVGTVVFTTTLVSAALVIVLFMSPSAFHRLVGRRERRQRVRDAVRAQLAGLVLLAAATVQAVFLVVRFVYDTTVAAWTGGVLAIVVIVVWILVPLARRMRGR